MVSLPLHHPSGQTDKQLESVYVMDPGPLQLPLVGDWVVVIVTAVVSATKFYLQMPLGAKSPFLTSDKSSDAGTFAF